MLTETERGLEATGEEAEVSGAAEWVCEGVAASGEVSVLRLPDGRLVAVRREASFDWPRTRTELTGGKSRRRRVDLSRRHTRLLLGEQL